jgi:hypothetical protein
MPTYPVRDIIVENVLDTLRTIRIENDYQIEMGAVQRHDEDKDISVTPACTVEENRERKTHMTFPYQHNDLPITIWCLIGSWTELTRWQNIAIADISKAMFVDYDRGGYAINTIEEGNEIFYVIGTNKAGVKMDFLIKYRHKWNDPYAQFA